LSLVLLLSFPALAEDLRVHIINVGQGDAIYITCPGGEHQLLIDSGDRVGGYTGSSKAFKDFMQDHQNINDELELVIASHPHADHIGNLAWVLKKYDVGSYIDNGMISRVEHIKKLNTFL